MKNKKLKWIYRDKINLIKIKSTKIFKSTFIGIGKRNCIYLIYK